MTIGFIIGANVSRLIYVIFKPIALLILIISIPVLIAFRHDVMGMLYYIGIGTGIEGLYVGVLPMYAHIVIMATALLLMTFLIFYTLKTDFPENKRLTCYLLAIACTLALDLLPHYTTGLVFINSWFVGLSMGLIIGLFLGIRWLLS